MVQEPITRSCCSAEWTAPKAAVRSSTFFSLSPTSSAALLLVSAPSEQLALSSADLLASSSALTWPSSCSSRSSITPRRSVSLSASASQPQTLHLTAPLPQTTDLRLQTLSLRPRTSAQALGLRPLAHDGVALRDVEAFHAVHGVLDGELLFGDFVFGAPNELRGKNVWGLSALIDDDASSLQPYTGIKLPNGDPSG